MLCGPLTPIGKGFFLITIKMIEYNDLRIGNLLQLKDGTIAIVEEIRLNGFKCRSILEAPNTDIKLLFNGHYHDPYSRIPDFEYPIQPILITEEWLLKLGFEKQWVLKDKWHEWELKNISITDDFRFQHSGTNIKLNYIHNLQNLYFALTGKELNL